MNLKLLDWLDQDCQRLIWSHYIWGIRKRSFLKRLCNTGYNPSSLTESQEILKSFQHTAQLTTLFDAWKYVNVRNMIQGNFQRNVLPPFVQPSLRYIGISNNYHVFAREHLPVEGEPLMIEYDWYNKDTCKYLGSTSYIRENLYSDWRHSDWRLS